MNGWLQLAMQPQSIFYSGRHLFIQAYHQVKAKNLGWMHSLSWELQRLIFFSIYQNHYSSGSFSYDADLYF
jgi:hypothetical protein